MKGLVLLCVSCLSAKQWLSRARGMQARIDSLRAGRDCAYIRATSCTVPLRPDAGGSPAGSGGYDARVAYVALSMKAERQEAQFVQVCEEILYIISQVENNTLAILLQEHYINGKSLREIALAFHYFISRVYQLHQKAIEAVQEILEFSLEPSAWQQAVLFCPERGEIVQLYQGDCLEIMRNIPDHSVDMILTDPLYSSGGLFAGDRKVNTRTKYTDNDCNGVARF